MDEDRIRGSTAYIGGKVNDAAGGLLGDSRTQAEDKADQASGQIRNAYGSAKDAVREGADAPGTQVDALMKERPMAALLGAVGGGYILSQLVHR